MSYYKEKLESYFNEFIHDNKDEIEFCLTQSQVELFIRFKFAYWVSKRFKNSFSLIETGRIDLVIEIEGNKYCLEFGHMINLLKHSPHHHDNKEDGKVKSDCNKLYEHKIQPLKKRIPDFFNDGNVCCCTVSLFTDFHLEESGKKYIASYFNNSNRICTGIMAKYGTALKGIDAKEYYTSYRDEVKNYNSITLKANELSFYWNVEECDFNILTK
jgi:hypothetical protein